MRASSARLVALLVARLSSARVARPGGASPISPQRGLRSDAEGASSGEPFGDRGAAWPGLPRRRRSLRGRVAGVVPGGAPHRVLPTSNSDPDAGRQDTAGVVSTASVALTRIANRRAAGRRGIDVEVPGHVEHGRRRVCDARSRTIRAPVTVGAGDRWRYTVVVPSTKVDPDDGRHAMTGAGSSASLAVAA